MCVDLPQVSVIIPTCNRADFLKNAIDSVLSQTFGNFELIIVDDGSTDHTPELIKEYGQKVRYIPQDNRGVSNARNVGIRA
ncbi:glycosyl transferase, partial [candidate division KSB3 bacterium]